jgi:ATP-dependent DNA helicase RecG
MINLDTPIPELPKVGKTQIQALARVEVKTVRDLLFYFPFRYLDFSKFSKIADAKPGEIITLRVKIKSIQARFSFKTRRSLCEAVVSDDSGSLKVIWFNQGYLAKSLKPQQEVLLSGKVEQYKGLQMANPVHELVSEESIHTGRIVPIYHITEGLYHRTLRSLVKQYLPLAKDIVDPIPPQVKATCKLVSLPEAIKQIHFPEKETSLEQSKFRIIFEEVFIQQLAVEQHKLNSTS